MDNEKNRFNKNNLNTYLSKFKANYYRLENWPPKYEVSLRTIYRDIRMLQDAGVPIGSRHGIGYFIAEGYYLPPVMLTQEEATALLVSEQLVINQGDKSFTGEIMKVCL